MNGSPPARGLFASLRRLLATLLELAQVRLELLLTELEQEKLRLFDALVWAGIALLGLGLGLLLLAAFVVLLFPEPQRVLVLGVLVVLSLGGGLWALKLARDRLRGPDRMFDATLAEFSRDRADLAGRE